MADKSIRLGSILTFDEDKEADIIKMFEYLNSSHKTGQFISSLVRLAVDCPEVFKKDSDGMLTIGPAMRKVDIAGLSEIRKNFMSDIIKKVEDMKKKVDEIYEQSLKTYVLAQMGKHLGIEGKSKNVLMADFVVEKQLGELQKSLGIVFKDNVYASNKLADVQKVADDSLELIIESYDGIVKELKNFTTAVTSTAVVANNTPHMSAVSNLSAVTTTKQTETATKATELVDFGEDTIEIDKSPVEVSKSPAAVKSNSTEEFVDFSSDPEDLDVLANFFGD
jgi:hypothetical protein